MTNVQKYGNVTVKKQKQNRKEKKHDYTKAFAASGYAKRSS